MYKFYDNGFMMKKYLISIMVMFVVFCNINLGLSQEKAPIKSSTIISTTSTKLYLSHRGFYAPTVEAWETSLKELGVGGTSWIGVLGGNGVSDRGHANKARDSIIFVPHCADFSRSINVLVFFHGLEGFSKRDFQKRIIPHVRKLCRSQMNFVLLIPELPWSKNVRRSQKGRRGVWRGMRGDNFATYIQNSLLKVRTGPFQINLGSWNMGEIILIGHSNGGSALRFAAKGGSLEKVKPSKIIFSDADYGMWTKATWDHYIKKHPQTQLYVLVRGGDTPHKQTRRFLRSFEKGIPTNIHMKVFSRASYSHTDIGDEALLWVIEH